MAFVPRTFEQIRDDMIAFVQTNTLLTDFEVGSVIRTIIEAAAIEDDEQYFQMVQLLDAFRLSTATGQDLDDRLEEYDIVRLLPASATGSIVIRDGTLITNQLAFDVLAGATMLILDDSDGFPTSGFPYTVRIGEGTTSVEDIAVSGHVHATNTLTVAALTNGHNAGDRVSFVSGALDVTISSGLLVQVPPTAFQSASIVFAATEDGVLVNGNFQSTPISIRAQAPGTTGNVGVGRIIAFTSGPPFDGAQVTNLGSTSGGRDRETDDDFRDRGREQIQSLSNGTVTALTQAALGVQDDVTGQRVATANILEDFTDDEVILYIDDGTGFIPDQVELARSTVAVAVAGPIGVIEVADATDFPEAGFVIVSPESSTQIRLREYTSVDYGTNELTLAVATLAGETHDIGDEVAVVDVLTLSSEAGANFFQTGNFPIVRNSNRLWIDEGGGLVLQVEDTDFFLNRAKGQIELLGAGVTIGSTIITTYTYYTGLIASVQKVIDGVPDDDVNFPGVACAGSVVLVETPIIRRITVRLSISVLPGFLETDVAPEVQEVAENYITSLGIGVNVILAEITERAMGVAGMFNLVIVEPTSDVVVLEDELSVPFDASGNSLVTVT